MAAKDKTSPPPSVWLARQCERYNALPRSGGINEQSYRELIQMRVLSSAYDAVLAWYAGRVQSGDNASKIVLALAADGII